MDRDITDLSCRHFRVNSPSRCNIVETSFRPTGGVNPPTIMSYAFCPVFFNRRCKFVECSLFLDQGIETWRIFLVEKLASVRGSPRWITTSENHVFRPSGKGKNKRQPRVPCNAVRTSVTIKVWRHSSYKRSCEWRDNSTPLRSTDSCLAWNPWRTSNFTNFFRFEWRCKVIQSSSREKVGRDIFRVGNFVLLRVYCFWDRSTVNFIVVSRFDR